MCIRDRDGTVQSFLNHSIDYVDDARRAAAAAYPSIGVLKLGTGNAISAYTGAEDYLPDLQRMVGWRARRQKTSLIEVEGQQCHFAGFGLDAAILNDYLEVKDTWLGKKLRYALSVPAVTLPKQFLNWFSKYPLVHIINEGRPAYRIGPHGQTIGRPIATGETIYHGPMLIAGAATTPYYGYGLKLYPHVERRPGTMQLRVAWASPIETISRLPSVWNGTCLSKNIRDFYCDKIRFVFDQDAPFQIGGDGAGTRQEATFSLSEHTIELIDLTEPENTTIN